MTRPLAVSALLAVLLCCASFVGAQQAAGALPATTDTVTRQRPFTGEVAFAAPPVNETLANATLGCDSPCYVVKDTYPFKTCKPECNAQTCSRGFGVWSSEELCCAPGLAFPDGCSRRPEECWVAENPSLRTCVRDDRKCLAGSGVYGSHELCCTPGAAFQEGCGNVILSPDLCWVVDLYYPVRSCRQSAALCNPQESNVQSWPSEAACCGPSGAFGSAGCSNITIPTPCWVTDTYYPDRRCRLETDVATCYRGWAVFQNEDICCAPGAAFQEGCTTTTNTTAGTMPPAAMGAAATPAMANAGRRLLKGRA